MIRTGEAPGRGHGLENVQSAAPVVGQTLHGRESSGQAAGMTVEFQWTNVFAPGGHGNVPRVPTWMVRVHAQKGTYREAIAESERVLQAMGDSPVGRPPARSDSQALAGQIATRFRPRPSFGRPFKGRFLPREGGLVNFQRGHLARGRQPPRRPLTPPPPAHLRRSRRRLRRRAFCARRHSWAT
jgi:hypothetical protein